MLQAVVSYPGINQIISFNYAFTHGIDPGVATIEMAPQTNLPSLTGNLVISYGDVSITLVDCKVDLASFHFDQNGQLWHLSIFDRRWKWQFGKIYGNYNVRTRADLLWDPTEQSPQQLAQGCLDAMGETAYDVSILPNDTRPEVNWQGDVSAECLDRLIQRLGCRLTLNLDDTVSIVVIGVGEVLVDDGTAQAVSATVDFPEMPDSMTVVCGPSRYQADLALEAVGVDSDGTVKPINDLSYAPTGGWTTADLDRFNAIADLDDRSRAVETVFRWYRIKGVYCQTGYADFGDEECTLDGNPLDSLYQLLPVEREQVDTMPGNDATLGTGADGQVNRPAWVFGQWYDRLKFANVATTLNPPSGPDDITIYQGPFVLDVESGIVKFEEPLYFLDSSHDNVRKPANLVLRCAFPIRDAGTFSYIRYECPQATGSELGTPTRAIHKEELVRALSLAYTSDYDSGSTHADNADDVDEQAGFYLAAAAIEYAVENPQSVGYAGIKAFDLDGAIQQIVWSVNSSGATTQVNRNNETHPSAVNYQERRFVRQSSADVLQLHRRLRAWPFQDRKEKPA